METIIRQSVGIDISNDTFHACFYLINARGQSKRKGRVKQFANSVTGFINLLAWVDKNRVESSLEVTLIMEATGVYHEQLAYFAYNKAYRVAILLPNTVKAFAKSLNELSKTDTIDAQVIARMGVERQLRTWSPMSPQMEQLKMLNRQRQAFIKHKTALLNQQHADNKRANPVKSILKRGERMIKAFDNDIKGIEQEIKDLLSQDEVLQVKVKRLCTIPGVGLITATTFLAETDGLVLFKNRSQLISYCGFDIKRKDSGTSVKGRSSISKSGNSHIRKSLYMPSLSTIQQEGIFQNTYQRVVDRTGHGKMGLVAVQRKMLHIMFACHKNEQDYDPNYAQSQA